MKGPTTPANAVRNGAHGSVDDRSDDADDTNMEETPAGADVESKAEKLMGGRAWIESDGPTDYSLYSNPASLGLLRQRLFDVEDSIEMSPSDFDMYFPFVDNVWRKNKAAEGDNSVIAETYWCRLKKSSNQKPYVPKPTPEGKTSRKKRIREDKTCPMAIKVVRRDDSVRSCTISRAVGPEVKHSHDLDYMDNIKRNSGIMDIARREAVKGFLPGSVYWKLQEEPDRMEEAGGKFMKISDVRNVQYAWRQDNPSIILKAHHGYNQTGRGPKPKVESPAVKHPQLPPHIPPPVSHQTSHQTPQQTLKQIPPSIPPHASPRAPSQAPPQVAPPHVPQHMPQQPPPHVPKHAPPPPQQIPPHVPQHINQQPQSQPAQPPHHAPNLVSDPARGALTYPDHARNFLEPYLPNYAEINRRARPHVTLTWATSLDARISLMPGIQTAISGPETKAMTHYLRSRHDAIVIGVRTAISDDPSLNCRLAGVEGYGGNASHHQPRPIIVDPHARLHVHPDMKVLKVVSEGRAKGPWIVIAPGAKLHPTAVSTLKSFGGEYLMIQDVNPQTGQLNWEGIFNVLFKEGIKSIMIEGGGQVLSELLTPRYGEWIDSVVLTVAPTFFGRAGTEVSPEPTFDQQRRPIATRLNNVRWQPMGDSDVVMCGNMKYTEPRANGMLPGIAEFSQGPPDQQRGSYPIARNGH